MRVETTDSLIECPACGYIDNDSSEFGDGAEWEGEIECAKCGTGLYVSRTISVTYTATLLPFAKDRTRDFANDCVRQMAANNSSWGGFVQPAERGGQIEIKEAA